MAHSRQTISAFRYGFGFGADAPPQDADGLLAHLKNRRERLPVSKPMPTKDRFELFGEYLINQRPRNRREEGGQARFKATKSAIGAVRLEDFKRILIRAAYSRRGFRERLAWFWTDHFTAEAKNTLLSLMVPDMIETAIRPNLGRSFAEMLQAVTLHPAMLTYLNQKDSVGPNSPVGKRRKRGLNENLARELLELHTLGVGAGYTQKDVRQLAELLTGLTIDENGFLFQPRTAEPGAEQVLGKSYGGTVADLASIKSFLNDLALRPETARHIATKLTVHFISRLPDPNLIDTMTDAFLHSSGDLSAVYRTMLEHPAAWTDLGAKVRQPVEFVAASIRALDVKGDKIAALSNRQLNTEILGPLRQMGQMPFRPSGPDGWSEDETDWITPPALAARIIWGSKMAARYGPEHDPRTFVEATLGDAASDTLRLAVTRAASRGEAISLVLASPEFNRR